MYVVVAFCALLGCIIIWAQFAQYFVSYALNGRQIALEEAGAWGDSFAVLNTLFSGAAFIGLLLTVVLQKKALADQKRQFNIQIRSQKNQFNKQYNIQSTQISEQSKQFETQNTALLKNKFDVTFFEFLKFKTDLRNALEYRAYNQESKIRNYNFIGVNSFDRANEDLSFYIGEIVDANLDTTIEELTLLMDEVFYKYNDVSYSIYFRTLYRFFKLIYDAEYLTEIEKIDYANIVRAQLSGTEVLIIGMNGLNPNSGDLRKYIEEYRLLKYSNKGPVRSVLEKHYDPVAFTPRGD